MMSVDSIEVQAVISLAPGRVAVVVDPPGGLDLQHIYRTGLPVYWNPVLRRLEDRGMHEESHAASFRRIFDALLQEYGLRLRLTGSTRWRDVPHDARKKLEDEHAQ